MSPDLPSLFATCSNDGTVKLFDCVHIEGRAKQSRSKWTYNQPNDGQVRTVKSVSFCQSSHSIAAAYDNGIIQVLRLVSL